MTLVFGHDLGRLVQSQFGINELASAIAVGKASGSLLARKSDASVFTPLASELGLLVRPIPKYLEGFTFDRSGTVYGANQRRIKAPNVLEGVTLASVEGIATLLVLVLRHVDAPGDLTDQVEAMLKGASWIVGCQPRDPQNSQAALPYPLRSILRSFVVSVTDADADSEAMNQFRLWMNNLVSAVGSGEFVNSKANLSQHEQDRFLQSFLGDPKNRMAKGGECSDFDTFSARAAMVALACAANGAAIQIRCVTPKAQVVRITNHTAETRASGGLFTFTLWLITPPPTIAETLRNYEKRFGREPSWTTTGPLPIFGGQLEIAKLVASQVGLGAESQNETQTHALVHRLAVPLEYAAIIPKRNCSSRLWKRTLPTW